MKLVIFLREALRAIWANKLRTFLTLLGILIGVFAVTTLVSLGEGVKEELTKQIADLGSNILFVVPAKLKGGFQLNPASLFSGEILTRKDLQTIEKVEGVKKVTPIQFLGVPVFYKDKPASGAFVMGVSKDAFSFSFLEVEKGRIFQEKDEAVVGKEVLENLGLNPEQALGQKLRLKERVVSIVGIFKTKSDQSVIGQNEMSFVVAIPIELAAEIEGKEKIFRIMVQLEDSAEVKTVKKKIETQLQKLHREEISVLDQEDLVDFLGTFLSLMTALVSAIAAISLLVGGVGIMNIMLVSVTERTKEIGLRKAVGAKPKDILLQFLLEAMVLTFLGGVIGVLLSVGVLFLVSLKTPLPFLFSYKGVLIGTGVSILVGLLFGLFPAWQASRKDPIQALRYE